MQYLTTIMYDIFEYDKLMVKRLYTIANENCTSQAKLPCPSGEARSIDSTDLVVSKDQKRGLTQSYDNSPDTNRKLKQKWQHKCATKTRFHNECMRTDLGWSVGATTATQLVWINWITGDQPSHYPAKLWNWKDTHLKILLAELEDQQLTQAEIS